MKRSIWFLSSLRIQSLYLGVLSLCLLASGCAYHYDWVREPFGPGTGPSMENCCYAGPGCGHGGCGSCGGCATGPCCETEYCEPACGGGCEVACGEVACDNNCAPPATLCKNPRGYRGDYGYGRPYPHGPLTWAFGLLGFGGCGGCAHGGCGEMYWGDFHGDPPDVCDPCDCFGNYTGGCSGCGGQVYPPRPACTGCAGGCSDCTNGGMVSGYPMEGEAVYSDGGMISPGPAVAPSAQPRTAPRTRSTPAPGATVPSTNGKTGRINYNLPPGAKIISETDHVQTAAPRPTLAPRRR